MRLASNLLGTVLVIGVSLSLPLCSCGKQPAGESPTPPPVAKQVPPASVGEKSGEEPAGQQEGEVITKGTYAAPTEAEIAAAKAARTRQAIIQTEKGDITVELYGEETPLTVANFVKLAQAGFYKGLTFHRVVPGFVIQGGDPKGNGSGGPGYAIKREVSPKLKHVEGALAMARASDPDSAGSQFYITLAPTPQLDGGYAVFGKVIKGMDVAKKIAVGDKIKDIVVK